MIYIVNGFPGSGKTTFEDMVCKIMGPDTFAFKISTIDFVKEVARTCGWDGTKDLHNRAFLSDLKDLLTDWNDVPYKKVKEFVKGVKEEFRAYDLNFDKCAIFIDCREPWEIARLCRDFCAKSLLIRRDNDFVEVSNHADSQVLNYNYDIVIHNDSDLQALAHAAVDFVKAEGLYCDPKEYQIDMFGNIT